MFVPDLTGESAIPVPDLVNVGIVLIVVGFILVLSLIVARLSSGAHGLARGGAVVIVGFFPVVFGSDTQSARILMTLSIVLVAFLLALFLAQVYS